jgi:hypothetical protein
MDEAEIPGNPSCATSIILLLLLLVAGSKNHLSAVLCLNEEFTKIFGYFF